MRVPVALTIALPVTVAMAWAATSVPAAKVHVLPLPGGNGCVILQTPPTRLNRNCPCSDLARFLAEEVHIPAGSGVLLLLDSRVPEGDITAISEQLVRGGYVPMRGSAQIDEPSSSRQAGQTVVPGHSATVPPPKVDHIATAPPEVDRHIATAPPDAGSIIVLTPPTVDR